MAGQIAELAHRTLKRDFRAINTRDARVILLDAAPQVLPPFGKKLGEHTKKDLEKLGVEVHPRRHGDRPRRARHRRGLQGRPHRADRRGHQDLGGRRAGQPAGPDAGRADRRPARPGRPDRRQPRPHAAGPPRGLRGRRHDRARQPARASRRSRSRARSTPPSRSSGRVEGKPPQPPFKYFDKGSMATISRFKAVALIGKLRLTGFIAWLVWLALHLIYITGFKSRLTALMHWFVSFLGRGRAERTTTEQQIYARAALQRLRGRRGRPGLGARGVRPGAGDPRGHPARRARGAGHGRGSAHRLRRARAARRTPSRPEARPLSRRGGRPRARG